MIRIHIARDRRPLGNFSPNEVADGLKSGRFLPTDLAWKEPMESWRPLSEFTDLPEPEVDDAAELAPPLVPSASGESVAYAATSTTEPAWERRQEMGFLSALLETVKQVLSTPSETFRQMKRDGGIATPLLYHVITATLGFWALIIYQIITLKVAPQVMPASLSGKITPEMMTTSLVAWMVLAPAVIVIAAFMTAGVIHIILMGFAGSEKSFEATFRAVCYAVGTTALVWVVPWCGSWIFPVATVVLLIIAIREVHGLSTGKASAVVLLPMVTCCGLFALGYGMLAAAVLASGQFK